MRERMGGYATQPVGRATLGDMLHRQARRQPDVPALVIYRPDDSRLEWSYATLDAEVNRAARVLRSLGVQRGDVVAMTSPNSAAYAIAYLAALKIGAAFTGADWRYRETELLWQLNHCEPVVLLVDDAKVQGLTPLLGEVPSLRWAVRVGGDGNPPPTPWKDWTALTALETDDSPLDFDVDEDDVALLVYTSGTESHPKGVLIPHRNFLLSTTPSLIMERYLNRDDVYLLIKPFHTIAGLGSLTSLISAGATTVMSDPSGPARVLEIIARDRVTTLSQTPTFYIALAEHEDFAEADLSSLRDCHTYGGLISRGMLQRFNAKAPDVLWASYWGQSELTALGTIGRFRDFSEIPGGDPRWIGKPTPHLEVRVVDDAGNAVERGELLCRSPSTMLGYHRDPERTAQTIRNGWVHTGDIVRIDDDGNLFFEDRLKDVIKSGGVNISSLEVEDALLQHPGISAAAVVGLPDAYWSEAVTGFVTAQAGVTLDPAEIIAYCRERLAPYKAPKRVHIVDQLPTDAQGKVLKRQLRNDHSAVPAAEEDG